MREEEMNCKEICELLTAYLDGEVTPEEKANIDAHLAGCPQCRAEMEGLSETRDNLRSALTSMAEEAAPSPQAWEKIRNRLETKESRKGFWSNFTLGRVATAATVVAFLAIAIVVWQFGGVGQAPPIPAPAPTPAPAPAPSPTPTPSPTVPPPVITIPPAPTPTPVPSPAPGPTTYIKASASLNKETYLPGEDIIIEFSFKNVTPEVFQIDPFPPLVEIGRHSEVLRSFTPREIVKTLSPDEVVTYTLTWDQTDEQGKQVPYGNYYIKLGDIKLGDRTMSLSLSGTRQFLILPAEGVIEKTVEMNEPRTIDGIIITLNRVELTATGMEVYAFNTPPSYYLSERPQPTPPEFMKLHAEAEYSLDGGVMIEAGPSGIGFLDDGMRHSWTHLDPVPKGTREITFVITKLGDWEGPWEFKVPLE
jgi:hypothetical protein